MTEKNLHIDTPAEADYSAADGLINEMESTGNESQDNLWAELLTDYGNYPGWWTSPNIVKQLKSKYHITRKQ